MSTESRVTASTKASAAKPKPSPVAKRNQGTGTSNVPLTEADAIRLKKLENAYRELVAGSLFNPYLDLIRGLPPFSDDIERDFGLDIYDKMVNSADVSAGLETLLNRVLDQFQDTNAIVPAVDAGLTATGDALKEVQLAKEVCQFVQTAVAAMEVPFEDVVQQVLWEALKDGHKLSEIVMQDGVYDGATDNLQELGVHSKGQPVLFVRALDPKPREVFRFVVDRHNRVLAILAIIPGVGLAIPQGILPDPSKLPNTVSPEKFVLLTFPGKNRDPRGRSKLRPAYNAWWLQTQTWVKLLQWLDQLAGGFIWGETPPDAEADPTQPGTLEDQHAAKIATIRQGYVVAVKNGGSIHVERPEGNGEQFWNSIDGFGRQIFTAILTQARSNKEAEHGSKADSSAGTDLVDAVVDKIRGILARTIRKQFFHTIVKLNFGERIADRYAPILNLNGVPEDDWAETATAAGALGIQLSPAQQEEIKAKRLGVTPDLEWARQNAEQKAALATAAANRPTVAPGQPEPDKGKPDRKTEPKKAA